MKNFLIIIFLVQNIFVFSQTKEKKTFFEFSSNFSFINNLNKFDDKFSSYYQDYNKNTMLTVGIGFASGYAFNPKISILIDEIIYTGLSIKNTHKKQYKKLNFYTSSVLVEYNFFRKNNYMLSARLGGGIDISTFLYNRKITDTNSISHSISSLNAFVPVEFIFWFVPNEGNNKRIGISLRGNITVLKGKPNVTGLDIELDKSLNISQNMLNVGVKFML